MTVNTQKKRFSLARIIVGDLFKNQKLALLLLMLIIVSAMSVLWTTKQVREQVAVREQLILERNALESEWRNLIIEENVLADPTRVAQRANLLGMQYVSSKNETVIVIKN